MPKKELFYLFINYYFLKYCANKSCIFTIYSGNQIGPFKRIDNLEKATFSSHYHFFKKREKIKSLNLIHLVYFDSIIWLNILKTSFFEVSFSISNVDKLFECFLWTLMHRLSLPHPY